MGFYIICSDCKIKEKNRHPACQCRQNKYNRLLSKIIGATVLDMFMYENSYYYITLTKYHKDDIFYTTHHLLRDQRHGEYDYPFEINERSYNLHKLYRLDYDYDTLDKLFVFNLIFNRDIMGHVLAPLLNDIVNQDED